MARLSLLVIQGDKKNTKEKGDNSISKQAYTAIELFMHFFPKTEIDGAGKITIHFCHKPDDKEQYFFSEYFKISYYYVDENLRNNVSKLKTDDIDGFFLDVLENVLVDIAKKSGNMEVIPIICSAVAEAKNTGYRLLIPIKKLSKQSPNRAYKAVTYRYLTPDGELDFIEIMDKAKEKHRYMVSNGYEKFPLEWYANKCEWIENRFVIKDRQDCVRAYVDADIKEMYSMQNKNKTYSEFDL